MHQTISTDPQFASTDDSVHVVVGVEQYHDDVTVHLLGAFRDPADAEQMAYELRRAGEDYVLDCQAASKLLTERFAEWSETISHIVPFPGWTSRHYDVRRVAADLGNRHWPLSKTYIFSGGNPADYVRRRLGVIPADYPPPPEVPESPRWTLPFGYQTDIQVFSRKFDASYEIPTRTPDGLPVPSGVHGDLLSLAPIR